MDSLEQYLIMKKKVKKLDGLSEKIQKQKVFLNKLEKLQEVKESYTNIKLDFNIENGTNADYIKVNEQEIFKVLNISKTDFMKQIMIPNLVEQLKSDFDNNIEVFNKLFNKPVDLNESEE